jgi:hypothetical protein
MRTLVGGERKEFTNACPSLFATLDLSTVCFQEGEIIAVPDRMRLVKGSAIDAVHRIVLQPFHSRVLSYLGIPRTPMDLYHHISLTSHGASEWEPSPLGRDIGGFQMEGAWNNRHLLQVPEG